MEAMKKITLVQRKKLSAIASRRSLAMAKDANDAAWAKNADMRVAAAAAVLSRLDAK